MSSTSTFTIDTTSFYINIFSVSVGFSKRGPSPLVPDLYTHSDQKLLYVSSENQSIPHSPFGPSHYFKGKPSWYINGMWLNPKEVKIAKNILSDPSIAPLFLNHKIFRYPAQWVLENGPVLVSWDGEKYRPPLRKRVTSALKTILCLWQKLLK